MRDRAVSAILEPAFHARKATATLCKKVERAIAKQAVEPLRVRGLVAGEILALRVAKKPGAGLHGWFNEIGLSVMVLPRPHL